MHERRRLRRSHFPIAAFADASSEIALLGSLFDNERRAAFRTRLSNWLVRSGEVAIRISAATVENSAAPSSLGRAAPDEFSLIALRAFDPQRDRTRVLALRIILAADEIPVPSCAPQ